MTAKDLLDSFKNYEIIRKQGKDVRPGDRILLKSIDTSWHCFGDTTIDSFVVKAVNIQSWYDGSINVEVDFIEDGVVSSGLTLNGHNYYDIKLFY